MRMPVRELEKWVMPVRTCVYVGQHCKASGAVPGAAPGAAPGTYHLISVRKRVFLTNKLEFRLLYLDLNII